MASASSSWADIVLPSSDDECDTGSADRNERSMAISEVDRPILQEPQARLAAQFSELPPIGIAGDKMAEVGAALSRDTGAFALFILACTAAIRQVLGVPALILQLLSSTTGMCAEHWCMEDCCKSF